MSNCKSKDDYFETPERVQHLSVGDEFTVDTEHGIQRCKLVAVEKVDNLVRVVNDEGDVELVGHGDITLHVENLGGENVGRPS